MEASIDHMNEREQKRKEAFENIEENEVQPEEFVKKAKKLKAVTVIEVKDSPPPKSGKTTPPELVRVSLLPEGKFGDKVNEVLTHSLKEAIEKGEGKIIPPSAFEKEAEERKKKSQACWDCLKECDELDYCIHSKKNYKRG